MRHYEKDQKIPEEGVVVTITETLVWDDRNPDCCVYRFPTYSTNRGDYPELPEGNLGEKIAYLSEMGWSLTTAHVNITGWLWKTSSVVRTFTRQIEVDVRPRWSSPLEKHLQFPGQDY